MRTASVIFLGIGFLVLVSLSWVAYNISHGFFNPLLGFHEENRDGCLTLLDQFTAAVAWSTVLHFGCLPCRVCLFFTVDSVGRWSGANSNTSGKSLSPV